MDTKNLNSERVSVASTGLVRDLLELLDKADELLSTGDVLLDGWPGARAWHLEYAKLPAGEGAYTSAGIPADPSLPHAPNNL